MSKIYIVKSGYIAVRADGYDICGDIELEPDGEYLTEFLKHYYTDQNFEFNPHDKKVRVIIIEES